MRFYYAMQPGFYFPALCGKSSRRWAQRCRGCQAVAGWRSQRDTRSPSPITSRGPTNVPKLKLGQTLTLAQNGLPDVWDQLSVEIPYEQSECQPPPTKASGCSIRSVRTACRLDQRGD